MKNLLVLGLVALATAMVPAQAGTFTLGPAATVGVGDSFDLTLTLADPFATHPGDAITSLGFNVGILDPSVVSYTGFTAGALFLDFTFGPVPTVLVFASDPAGLSPLSPGYTDPVIIGVLHFSALQYGTTAISVTTDAAGDPNQGIYYASSATAEDFNASSDATVVPEPGTLAISALGACALVLARRRRRAA